MLLTALNCESSFLYRQDKGTARCRLKLEDLNSFGIKLGNILKIKLFPSESLDSSVDILCIAWLNDAEFSDVGTVIIDDCVQTTGSTTFQLQSWSQMRCKVSQLQSILLCYKYIIIIIYYLFPVDYRSH